MDRQYHQRLRASQRAGSMDISNRVYLTTVVGVYFPSPLSWSRLHVDNRQQANSAIDSASQLFGNIAVPGNQTLRLAEKNLNTAR